MGEKDACTRFLWGKKQNGCPLDLSMSEAEKKWECDIPHPHHSLKRFRRDELSHLTKHSYLFADLFPDFSPDCPGHSQPSPIMVEASAFFRDYYLTFLQTKVSEEDIMQDPKDNANAKKFAQTFFRNAYDSIHGNPDVPIEGKPEELSYYEKMLYNQPAFQSFIAEHYWESEFDKRCRLLKKVVLKCPPHLRLKEMPHILRFLDAQIGAYSVLANREKDPVDDSMQTFLREFPAYLSQLRKSDYDYYFFDNISINIDNSDNKTTNIDNSDSKTADIDNSESITTQDLESVFYSLHKATYCKKRNKKAKKSDNTLPDTLHTLRESARRQYLISLSKKVEESDAYIQARDLDNYLQASTTRYTLEEIKPIIKEISRQYYSHLLKATDYQSFTLENVPINVTTMFLDGIISSMAHSFLNSNQFGFQLSPYMASLSLTELDSFNNIGQSNLCKMESPELFCSLFKKMVGYDFFDCIDNDPKCTLLELLVRLYAQCLYELKYPAPDYSKGDQSCKDFAAFIEEDAHFTILHHHIHRVWNTDLKQQRKQVEQYLNDSEKGFPFSDIPLRHVFLLVKLFEEYRHTIKIAKECYVLYQSEVEKGEAKS